MATYNLFCRKGRAELACAVPEDRPVPAFIKGELWEFGGKVNAMNRSACSFNHEAAEVSVRFNGFYLFQLVKQCRAHLISDVAHRLQVQEKLTARIADTREQSSSPAVSA